MTKIELIEALEALEVKDNCAVFVRTDDGYLHEIELIGIDQCGDIILSEDL